MEVVREVLLPAPAEEVWESLTDAARLEEWFATDVDFDLERGEGVFRWQDGEERRAVVADSDEGRRLVLRWWDPGTAGSETEVVFTLEELSGGTRLVVTETATGPRAWAGEWSWAVSLQAMPFGFWPAITRRAAASSAAPIVATIGAPCVLASLGASDPEARKHHLKGHTLHVGRQRLLCAV